MSKRLVIWLSLLCAALVPSAADAQLAPTGAHYAGRASDTGFSAPSESGGYAASIPLELPPARGGLPLPLQIVSGTKGFGAAGVGWDIPLSFVLVDDSFGRRRPALGSGDPVPRERITVSLMGRRVEMLPVGDRWVGRYATDLMMRREGNTFVVADGNGVNYTFTPRWQLAGAGGPFASLGGLWLLDTISGRGGSNVTLQYDVQPVIVSPFPDSPGPAFSVDLLGFSYNPGPTPGCFKHQVTIDYAPVVIGARPESLNVVGEIVLARQHKLDWISISSRAACGLPLQRLRRYGLSYVLDPDTRQPRLDTVTVNGQEGTAEANVALPIAKYGYGSASIMGPTGRVLRYGAPTSIPLPPTVSGAIAETKKVGASQFSSPIGGSAYASLQSFADFTGDGRPDLVYANNGALSIAAGRPGSTFAPPVPFNDNTFTRPVLDARSSDVDRFSDEMGTSTHHDYVWTKSVDVNGDGRIDVIDAAEQSNTWVLYLNTPDAVAPSGIRWERRSYDVTRARAELVSRGLVVPSDRLPLSHRITGRNTVENNVSAAWTPFWRDRSGGRIVRSDERHEDHMATAGGELAGEWADG